MLVIITAAWRRSQWISFHKSDDLNVASYDFNYYYSSRKCAQWQHSPVNPMIWKLLPMMLIVITEPIFINANQMYWWLMLSMQCHWALQFTVLVSCWKRIMVYFGYLMGWHMLQKLVQKTCYKSTCTRKLHVWHSFSRNLFLERVSWACVTHLRSCFCCQFIVLLLHCCLVMNLREIIICIMVLIYDIKVSHPP